MAPTQTTRSQGDQPWPRIMSLPRLNSRPSLKSCPAGKFATTGCVRKFGTPGWPHTLLLANTIGYLAEAAYHHPDLTLGYAEVTVKLQTHRVHGITASDTELAAKIDEVVLWKPSGGPWKVFPKDGSTSCVGR